MKSGRIAAHENMYFSTSRLRDKEPEAYDTAEQLSLTERIVFTAYKLSTMLIPSRILPINRFVSAFISFKVSRHKILFKGFV